MKYSSNKDINQLIRRLVCQGWRFRHGSKHGRLSHPSGRPTLTVPTTPGDKRSFHNFRRDLRQAVRRRPAKSTGDYETFPLAK
jgi:hypothetical protein